MQHSITCSVEKQGEPGIFSHVSMMELEMAIASCPGYARTKVSAGAHYLAVNTQCN